LCVPWCDYTNVLAWRESYDKTRFLNEVMGIPDSYGDHLASKGDVVARCVDRANELSPATIKKLGIVPESLTIGIDWGGGRNSCTAIVVGGHHKDGTFHILFMEKGPRGEDHNDALERVLRVVKTLPGHVVAADANGVGSVLNRILLADSGGAIPKLYGIFYADHMHKPRELTNNEMLYNVSKVRVIGDVYTRIRKGKITFPRFEDVAEALPDLWHETAEYNAEARALRYRCPAGMTDDTLHALAYSTYVMGKYLTYVA